VSASSGKICWKTRVDGNHVCTEMAGIPAGSLSRAKYTRTGYALCPVQSERRRCRSDPRGVAASRRRARDRFFAAGRNVAIGPDHPIGRESRVRFAQGRRSPGPSAWYWAPSVGQGVGALEFDADRIIIARLPAPWKLDFPACQARSVNLTYCVTAPVPSHHHVR